MFAQGAASGVVAGEVVALSSAHLLLAVGYVKKLMSLRRLGRIFTNFLNFIKFTKFPILRS